jgi:hypothetical protein
VPPKALGDEIGEVFRQLSYVMLDLSRRPKLEQVSFPAPNTFAIPEEKRRDIFDSGADAR